MALMFLAISLALFFFHCSLLMLLLDCRVMWAPSALRKYFCLLKCVFIIFLFTVSARTRTVKKPRSHDSFLSVQHPEEIKQEIVEILQYTDGDVEKIKEPLLQEASLL